MEMVVSFGTLKNSLSTWRKGTTEGRQKRSSDNSETQNLKYININS